MSVDDCQRSNVHSTGGREGCGCVEAIGTAFEINPVWSEVLVETSVGNFVDGVSLNCRFAGQRSDRELYRIQSDPGLQPEPIRTHQTDEGNGNVAELRR